MRFLTIGLCACLLALSFSATAAEIIGRVQLLLGGKLTASAQNGQMRVLREGMPVYEGDLLETSAGTIAHLRMKDNAFLGLRPGTQLKIACYHAQPAPCIRLELKKGEVRERTGRIGEMYRQRFRLNTPVAAIGIRGTDFVTRSEGRLTLVRVIAGEVVASPFGKGCTLEGLGPCATPWAASLNAAQNAILLVRPGQPTQRVLRVQPLHVVNSPSPLPSGEGALRDLSNDPDRVVQYLARHGLTPDQKGAQGPDADSIARYGDMVFATWTTQAEGISLPYTEAHRQRAVTVGSEAGALWRQDLPYQPVARQASFALKKGEATVMTATGAKRATLSSPRLDVDFVASRLSTRFTAIRNDTGAQKTVSARLPVSSVSGIFVGNTDQGGRIAGALSHDGKQAGYYVQQPWQGDRLDARLLWQAQ